MKKILVIAACFSLNAVFAQFGDLKKVISKPADAVKGITGQKNESSLTTNDIAEGLKEALNKGIERGTNQLSAADGFFKNAAVKILMPDEAKKVESSLRNIGMGQQVDDAILSMNRAAEDATKQATPIFLKAIKNMSFADAWAIFKGNDNAATNYLKQQTTNELTASFRPVIDAALQKVDATKHWNTVFSKYNSLPFVSKVNPDLTAYVTEKALTGIFYQLGLEESKIRKDPAARTTDILKNVFGKQ